MGVDITIWAEHQQTDGWHPCYDGSSPSRLLEFYPCDSRNRSLFRIFGYGWLECYATDGSPYGVEAIAAPRGFPDDSLRLQHVRNQSWGRDFLCGTDPTWYTLRELQDFPWTEKKARRSGYVSAEEYFYYFTFGRHYTLGELLDPLRKCEKLASRHWPAPNRPAEQEASVERRNASQDRTRLRRL